MPRPDPGGRRAALDSLVAALEPADDLEREHCDRVRALLQVHGDPFSRDHFVPGHITASAFVLSPDDADLLLIFHGKLHRWLQPGGHVDPEDADVIATARRELEEEVGLTDLELVGSGLFDVDVHGIPARKSDPAHEHFDIRLLFRAGTRDVTAGSDAHAARWVPLGDIASIESDQSVMRAVAKLPAQGE